MSNTRHIKGALRSDTIVKHRICELTVAAMATSGFASLFAVGLFADPAGAAYQPSRSVAAYYISNDSGSKMHDLGCALGNQDRIHAAADNRLLVLQFGAPRTVGGQQKLTFYNDSPSSWHPLADVQTDIQEIGYAYFICSRTPGNSYDDNLYIAAGVSNDHSDTYEATPSTWENSGFPFGLYTQAARDYFSSNGFLAPNVNARGNMDAEVSFGPADEAQAWESGFFQGTTNAGMYLTAAADGCPTNYFDSSTSCSANGYTWTYSDFKLMQVGEGGSGVWDPQIYRTDGVQAVQWAKFAVWMENAGYGWPTFRAATSQHGACEQVGGCLHGSVCLDNTQAEAKMQLATELKTWEGWPDISDSTLITHGYWFTDDFRWQDTAFGTSC
jgi:hypothetical protein